MYYEKQLVKIGKRENNKKRNYLVVNRLQGKHIPAIPSQALSMFKSLAKQISDEYKDERLLLIGFAETATAIGATIAIELKSQYIQTTREFIPNVDYIFFSEEHSHATEQKLVKEDIDKCFSLVDRIIFIEDEVTTGNTIMNIIRKLDTMYLKKMKYSIASLLNGMNEEAINQYSEKKIRTHYLVKTNHDLYDNIANDYLIDGEYIKCLDSNIIDYKEILVKYWNDCRRTVNAAKYKKSCEQLNEKIIGQIDFKKIKSVLVLGTEEFMYPALCLGEDLEKKGLDVKCHATTRSPISVSKNKNYPVHKRYELVSLYDSERKTFIYDLNKYDMVIIVTDSQDNIEEGKNSLLRALKNSGNNNIVLVRWCK